MDRPQQLEFRHDEWDVVLDAVDELAAAGTGWVNLLPEPVDDVPQVRRDPSPMALAFGGRQSVVPMATWVLGDKKGPTVGVTHNQRAKAMPILLLASALPPEGWVLVQDNARRGLVLRPRPGAPVDEVVGWMMEAVDALCPVPLTGHWLAELHRG